MELGSRYTRWILAGGKERCKVAAWWLIPAVMAAAGGGPRWWWSSAETREKREREVDVREREWER